MRKTRLDYFKKVVPFLNDKFGVDKAQLIFNTALSRYDQIVAENSNESKAVYMHTRERIYPSIALFDSLISVGIERQKAVNFVVDYYKWRAQKMAKFIHILTRIPGLYKKLPRIFTKMTKKMFGEASGFRAKYYDTTKTEMRIDMLECPYNNKCIQYGCPEIVRGFCESDDVCYAQMHPKLVWGRTKTLGKGGDCCDFKITVKD